MSETIKTHLTEAQLQSLEAQPSPDVGPFLDEFSDLSPDWETLLEEDVA